MQILKFIHVLIGVTILGLFVAYYFYFSLTKYEMPAARRMLKLSLITDCFVFIAIMLLFMTGTHLVLANHFSFQTPWIQMAYKILGLLTFCWLIIVAIKALNFFKKDQTIFLGKRVFHTCHVLIFILFVLIIHDAVTQSTFLR